MSGLHLRSTAQVDSCCNVYRSQGLSRRPLRLCSLSDHRRLLLPLCHQWSRAFTHHKSSRLKQQAPHVAETEDPGLGSAQMDVVTSEETFQAALHHNEVVVVDWMARWCRKCIYIKPKLDKLIRTEFPQVEVVFVDVNAVPSKLVLGAGVRKMPTVQIYRLGEKVAEHVCAEGGTAAVEKIREMLQSAVGAQEHAHAADG